MAVAQSKLITTLTTAIVVAVPLYCFTLLLNQRNKALTDDDANKKKDESVESLPYPPGPEPHWLFGNTLEISKVFRGKGSLGKKFLEWSNEYGPLFSVIIPLAGRLIVVTDLDLIRIATTSKNYEKGMTGGGLITSILGDKSLVILPKSEWLPKRKSFNPGFSPTFLKEMVTTMVHKLDRFVDAINNQDIANGQPTDMLLRSQNFTADVIVSIGFGEDWGGDKPHDCRMYLTEIAKLTSGLTFDPMKRIFNLKLRYDIRKYERLINQEMRNVLERRLAAGVSQNSKDICSLAINDLIKNNPDGLLTEDDKVSIVHQLKTFYFAGHDTTATTIAWAIWLLSQNPTVLQKVRKELVEKNILWKDGAAPTYDELQTCDYLEAVVKETLRMHPPAGAVSRRPPPDETYNGYRIGKKTVLLLSIYGVHHKADLWKTDPFKFHPDRFLDGSEGDASELAKKFLPFSRGPRDCIGKYFALLEAKLALSLLVTKYDFDCVDPNEEPVTILTTVPKNGAQVKFKHRNSSTTTTN